MLRALTAPAPCLWWVLPVPGCGNAFAPLSGVLWRHWRAVAQPDWSTGIDLSGGVINNGSWGILANDFADYSAAIYGVTLPGPCAGGQSNFTPPPAIDSLYAVPPPNALSGLPIPCDFNSFGNRVIGNVMLDNGSFGNPTNGDLANAAIPYPVNNCFVGNIDLGTGKPSSSPADLQNPSVAGVCGRKWNTDTAVGSDEYLLTAELGGASLGPAACTGLPVPGYPQRTQVKMFPNPHEEGMQNPCTGVPKNSWCR